MTYNVNIEGKEYVINWREPGEWEDVTIEMLKEKMPYFVVDGNARCQKSIAAFMKLRSHVDGDFRIKGNRYEDDEDDDEDLFD